MRYGRTHAEQTALNEARQKDRATTARRIARTTTTINRTTNQKGSTAMTDTTPTTEAPTTGWNRNSENGDWTFDSARGTFVVRRTPASAPNWLIYLRKNDSADLTVQTPMGDKKGYEKLAQAKGFVENHLAPEGATPPLKVVKSEVAQVTEALSKNRPTPKPVEPKADTKGKGKASSKKAEPVEPAPFTMRVSGRSFGLIKANWLPAGEARKAHKEAQEIKVGKTGASYVLTCSTDTAEAIAAVLETKAEALLAEKDAEKKADGRALAKTARVAREKVEAYIG